MILEEIRLNSFRLHLDTKLNFSDKINYIVGGNGQGKTSILESIYYLCTTKGLSQGNDFDAVNFGKESFEVSGFFKDLTKNKCRIFYSAESKKKSLFIDDKQVFKFSEVIGKFPVVTITQTDHSLTGGSPADRRKFVDAVISQSSSTYLEYLVEYNKTLRNRSALLSEIKETRNKSLLSQLDSWTNSLINIGTEIIRSRIIFIEEFEQYLETAYQNILEGKELPKIEYKTVSNYIEKIREELTEKFRQIKEEEIYRGTNLAGPHRDDFIFTINNLEVKKFGSQGQHKTFQVALRFGEFFYLKDKLGKTPIFLMDDVFGELDTYRSEKISGYLKKIGQAFITMTDFSRYSDIYRREEDLLINVTNGNISYA